MYCEDDDNKICLKVLSARKRVSLNGATNFANLEGAD